MCRCLVVLLAWCMVGVDSLIVEQHKVRRSTRGLFRLLSKHEIEPVRTSDLRVHYTPEMNQVMQGQFRHRECFRRLPKTVFGSVVKVVKLVLKINL